jgi:anti-anti-sigma factor
MKQEIMQAETNAALLILKETQTIERARELRQEMLEVLEREGDIVVDASQLRSLDTAGAQLLLALQRAAEKRSRPLRIRNAESGVQQALKWCGYLGQLDRD